MDEFEDYREKCANTPLFEYKAFSTRDGVVTTKVPKMNVMLLGEFCLHLGVVPEVWSLWRVERPDLADAMQFVEAEVYNQKFKGAATGLLNANFIARDLGLADRVNASVTNHTPLPPPVDATTIANCVHPDDPDPTGPNRPLYTSAQIADGVPFWEPKK